MISCIKAMDYGAGVDYNFKGYGAGVDYNFKGYEAGANYQYKGYGAGGDNNQRIWAGGDYQLKDMELAVITCIKAMELVVII